MTSEKKNYLFCLYKFYYLPKFKRQLVTSVDVISLEAFAATEFIEIFSDRQLRHNVVFRRFAT